jgi:nucleoside-diphosphate-sugar epimerase
MTTYLVTGGTGLIGNYVVRELVNRDSDDDVIVYDLYPNEEALDGMLDDVTLVEGDVTDTDRLFGTCDRYDPDRILHFAAYVAHKSWENPTEAIEINGIGTNNVFDAARLHDVKTCLYASSASVYGTVDDYYWKDDPVTVDEDETVKPQNPYAVTKYTNEVMGRTYDEKYSPAYVGVRIGGAWGLGRTAGATGQLNTFVREVALGRDATVPDYWTQWDRINLSYGKDAGRWFAEVVDRDAFTHHLYNQGNHEPYRIERLVGTLERLLPGVTIEYPTPDQGEEWSGGMSNPQLDCRRWYDDLGLTQRWSVEDAVVDYVNIHRRRAGLDPVALDDRG